MITRLLFLIFICPLFISCTVNNISDKQNTSNNKSINTYLKEVSVSSEISGKNLYYVSKKSDPAFLKKIHPSIIAFVKGEKTTTIDNLELPEDKNVKGLNSSCGVDDITKSIIEYNLKNYPNIDYNSVVLKNLETKEVFIFPKDQIISVMMYSKQMGTFANQYINTLKRIKKEFGIDYIIITMDGQDLNDIEDILYDSFNNPKIEVK